MAQVRVPRRRRAYPRGCRRARASATPRRGGAHIFFSKARRARARAGVFRERPPPPPLTPHPPPPPPPRLVALAPGRRPVSSGGYTGVRPARAPPDPPPTRALNRLLHHLGKKTYPLFTRLRPSNLDPPSRSPPHSPSSRAGRTPGRTLPTHRSLPRVHGRGSHATASCARTGRGRLRRRRQLARQQLVRRDEPFRFGGGSTARPSVIRVGQAFQAVVPPWRGPVPLDGSARDADRTTAAEAKTRGGGGGTRREEERAGRGAREGGRGGARGPAAAAAKNGPRAASRPGGFESEPRARNVWAGFGCGLRRGGRTRVRPARRPSKKRRRRNNRGAKVKSPRDAPRRTRSKRPRSGLETIAGGARGAAEGAAAFAAAAAAAAAKRARTAPTTADAIDPGADARGSRRRRAQAAAAARAFAASREADQPPAVASLRRRRRARRRRRLGRAAGAEGDDSFGAARTARRERARARPRGHGTRVARDSDAPPIFPSRNIPSADRGRGRRGGASRRRASRVAVVPALMGVSSRWDLRPPRNRGDGPRRTRARVRGTPSRAQVQHLRHQSHGNRAEETLRSAARRHDRHVGGRRRGGGDERRRDAAAIDGDSNATADGAEGPDPRLEGRSLLDMVDYYYNVWLTRPGSVDDDGDRSECEEDDVHPAAAKSAKIVVGVGEFDGAFRLRARTRAPRLRARHDFQTETEESRVKSQETGPGPEARRRARE